MTLPQNLQRRVARLLALMAIGRARRASRASINTQTSAGQQTMTHELEPTNEVKALTAELLDRLALNADGQPFADGDPSTWQAADEADPEVVRVGFAKFQIVDPDAANLALAAGAIDENSPLILCMRVRFENAENQPLRRSGQYIALDTEAGVKLLFRVWLTGEDVHDPVPKEFDLGPGTDNEALDVLQPGEALLVQVLGEADDEELAP